MKTALITQSNTSMSAAALKHACTHATVNRDFATEANRQWFTRTTTATTQIVFAVPANGFKPYRQRPKEVSLPS
jgi:hypothetical protein